jgi:hypothetical protein
MQFAKAKINKLRAQYLGERVYWSDEVKNVQFAADSDVDTTSRLRFIRLLCEYLDIGFPGEELM